MSPTRTTWLMTPLALAALACCSGSAKTSDGGALDRGGSDIPQGDCTSPGRSCVAPFVCRAPAGFTARACLSPEGDVPDCNGTPPGQEVPFQPTAAGPVVHWALAPGCVATSYPPAMADFKGSVVAAVKAWQDLDCSKLCIESPVENDREPDRARGERRLHFRFGQPSSFAAAMVTVDPEPETGRIYTAVVTIARAKIAQQTEADWVRMVGLGIGLARALPGVDSVMALDSKAKLPTANDRAALCTLYGEPAYCGD